MTEPPTMPTPVGNLECRELVVALASKLTDDIWSILQCLLNGEVVPRVLLKNGKQSKEFIEVSLTVQPTQPMANLTTVSSTASGTSPCTTLSTGDAFEDNSDQVHVSCVLRHVSGSDVVDATRTQVLDTEGLVQVPCTNRIPLPSRALVSEQLLVREVNKLKEEMRCMRSEINLLKRPSSGTTNGFVQHIPELLPLKSEIVRLNEAVKELENLFRPRPPPSPGSPTPVVSPTPNVSPTPPTPLVSSTPHVAVTLEEASAGCSQLKLASWNCRGLENAVPDRRWSRCDSAI